MCGMLIQCKIQNTISSPPFFRTGEVEFISSSKGTIQLLSDYSSVSELQASKFAERNALENILFRGIPGSNQEKPLIPSEEEAFKNHSFVLTDLILNYGYERFLIASYPDFIATNNGTFMVSQIVIYDIKALRKHLEKENVIRKFGL